MIELNPMIWAAIAIFAVTFIMKMPIVFSMFVSAASYFVLTGANLGVIADKVVNNFYTNWVIIAIPLFIFTSNIMNSGKVTDYMFTFCEGVIGKRRGALGYVNVLASLIFSGMTGSALADAAGIGLMEIDSMRKAGYDDDFSCAITAASATIGPVFPPSIPMVIFATLSGASTGRLFLGGMVPGVMIAMFLMVYVAVISKKRHYPRGKAFTFKQFCRFTLNAIPALVTPIILLTGIYTGIVTPTEAGALAACWAMIVSLLVYRSIGLKQLWKAMVDTALESGKIIIISGSAVALSQAVSVSGLSDWLANMAMNVTDTPLVFMLFINAVFFFLGMLLDTQTLQYVFVPIILPVVNALNIDLVWFGVIIVMNMMIGLSSPPYGMLCFVTSSIAKSSLTGLFREILPMVLVMIFVVLLCIFFPQLILFIPNHML